MFVENVLLTNLYSIDSFLFHKSFLSGLDSDYIASSDNEIIIHERKSALLIQPVIACRVYKGLILSAGYGIEYEHYKREKLGLFKLGLEYKLEMKKPGFYMLPSLSWDHTSEFDGLVYGMVFAFDF